MMENDIFDENNNGVQTDNGVDDYVETSQQAVYTEPVVEQPVAQEQPVAPEQEAQSTSQSQESCQTQEPQNNYYQYQNNSAYQPGNNNPFPAPKKTPVKLWIFIVGGLLFGLLAAVVFAGVTRLFDGTFPTDTVETRQIDSTSNNISFASGGSVAAGGDVSQIVDNVMPSVVSITQKYKQKGYSVFGEYVEKDATGSGSGFILKQDKNELLVVTNNHVVSGADKIQVTFIDQTVVDATVKGTDATADLAVLSIKTSAIKSDTMSKIKVATLGDSSETKVGQQAIAIGNALGYGQSVTVGYISAKDRKVSIQDETTGKANVMTLLQTDAAINPGNSGGPLLDAAGRVIGINSVKYASSQVEGMGYAIPMSRAVPIINELMKREVLSQSEKGYLGLTGRNISQTMSEQYGMPVGAYVVQVAKDGAAAEAGIKVGDIITKINGKEVTDIKQVAETVNAYRIGTEITVTLKRAGDGGYEEKKIKVKLKGEGTTKDLDTSNSSSGNSTSPFSGDSGNNDSSKDGSDYQLPGGNNY